ncbi:MAG: hypothetical protein CMJ45_14145 [Planctomyces sp.]|nr:hypothetical protein [Planctomyces sp.]
MKTTTNSTSNQDNGANGIFINLKGATEMTIATQIKKGKLGITNLVNNNTPARFLGALVLGAAMVAAAATGWVPGQVQASGNVVTNQTELGEEWFHPVTGEPIGPLPGQVSQRSQGVLASPSIIGSVYSWGPAEENFHPVTGVRISVAVENLEVNSANLGEEYFHPVTGQPNTGMQSKMAVSVADRITVSDSNLGEEYFHPVTGQPNTGIQGKMAVSGFGPAEENFHPVTGEMVISVADSITASESNLGEEYFHPVTGELE